MHLQQLLFHYLFISFIDFVSRSLSLIFTLCDFCVPINYIFKRLYITLYITFSQNLSKTLPPASAVISSRAFSEKLNQKFVNIPHTKWVKNNAILRCLCSARLSLYISVWWRCECKTTSVSHRLKLSTFIFRNLWFLHQCRM